MLIKLLPEQVEKQWNQLAPMISESLPPQVKRSRKGLTNILTALLAERAICWGYYAENEFHGIVITHTQVDPLTRSKVLVLYLVHAVKPITSDKWNDSVTTLKKHGKNKGCRSIIFYTPNDVWARYQDQRGVDGHYHMFEIDLTV